MLPGAALGSLTARFCWQGQHFRLWTVPERVSGAALGPRGSFLLAGAALQALDGARARFGAPPLAQHLGASRLVSAGRGSTSGSGRCPSAFRGPPLDAAGAALGSLAARFCWQGQHFRLWTVPERSTWEPRSSFLLAGAALQALDGARARFGAPPLDAARRSTWEPRGSFLLAGAALQALDGARARFGAPPLMLPGAALGSLAARFCWQGQHFRLWTVPERVSGPPARFCWWEPRGSFLLAGAALQALDGTRARFGAPPSLDAARPLLDAARRSTWEPRGSFLLAETALQALDGARVRFGAPPLMLPGAALGSLAAQVLDSLLLAHTLTRTLSQLKLGARRPFLPPLPALAFERCCKPSGLLVSASA